MPIAFFNIRSKETVVADSEEKIAALWASSDRSPNITQGQDFGWRLAPAVVVQMKQIKQDWAKLQEIAGRYLISSEDVGEKEILQYISETSRHDAETPVAEDEDYTDEYNEDIRRLQAEADAERSAAQGLPETTTTTTTEVPTTTTTTTKAK